MNSRNKFVYWMWIPLVSAIIMTTNLPDNSISLVVRAAAIVYVIWALYHRFVKDRPSSQEKSRILYFTLFTVSVLFVVYLSNKFYLQPKAKAVVNAYETKKKATF